MPPNGASVVLIAPPESDPLGPAVIGGALAEADGFPGVVADAIAPADGSAGALRAAAHAALLGKPTAVALWIDDLPAAADALAALRSARVTVVTIGLYPDDSRNAHVAIDWSGGAALLGEHLVEIAEQRRSYVLVHEDGRSGLGSSIYASFSAAARRQFALSLLGETAASGPGTAAAIDELLDRFRHTGLVITLGRDAWLSPQTSARLPNGARFAALSTAPPLWPRLRSGEAAALVGPLAGEIGRAAMGLLLKAAVRELRSDEVRYISCELVKPAGLDDFAARYIAAGALDPQTLRPRRTP